MKARRGSRAMGDHPERGAGALEWVAVMLIAAVLVGAVAVAVAPATPLTNAIRSAICTILGLGDGACAPVQESREPTEPCVTGRAGLDASMSVAVAVDLGGGTGLLIEELSNGQLRVTQFESASVGVSAGGAIEAGVIVDDNRFVSGVSAEAGAALVGESGDVWIVDNQQEVDALVRGIVATEGMEVITNPPGSPIPPSLNPVTWLSNKAADWVGLYDIPPEPNTTHAQAGIAGNASASWDLFFVMGAEASASVTEVAGVALHDDGTQTVYLDVEAGVGMTANVVTENTSPDWTLDGRLAMDLDENGEIAAVTFKTIDTDTDTQITAELPVNTPEDLEVVQQMLLNPQGFVDAAFDHGNVTRLTYDTDDSHTVGAVFEIQSALKAGLGAEVNWVNDTLESAEYWDGTQFVRWEGCQ
ncbi:MAG: hypothetical protein ACK5LS_08500 [Propioniciclava sp.]